MEDCNALAGDCVALSCCCQCLLLQLLVLILLRLPCKLIRKTMDFARRKIRERKRRARIVVDMVARGFGRKCRDEFAGVGEADRGCAIEEVERVMEELYERGELGFGSFWSKEDEDCDDGFVRFQLIEMLGDHRLNYRS